MNEQLFPSEQVEQSMAHAFKEGFDSALKSIFGCFGNSLPNPYKRGTVEWSSWFGGYYNGISTL